MSSIISEKSADELNQQRKWTAFLQEQLMQRSYGARKHEIFQGTKMLHRAEIKERKWLWY